MTAGETIYTYSYNSSDINDLLNSLRNQVNAINAKLNNYATIMDSSFNNLNSSVNNMAGYFFNGQQVSTPGSNNIGSSIIDASYDTLQIEINNANAAIFNYSRRTDISLNALSSSMDVISGYFLNGENQNPETNNYSTYINITLGSIERQISD
ncbi:MAG: hypothetical protein EB000_04665, partial [Alphaproteobacteria bacterium]|nr:hypothetical protein [Alphaproteobacteria bacterium]